MQQHDKRLTDQDKLIKMISCNTDIGYFLFSNTHTHTHTHTYIYIYIYIYMIWEQTQDLWSLFEMLIYLAFLVSRWKFHILILNYSTLYKLA